MSEALPLDEWVWVEGVKLACGCMKSSWVRTSIPATAEDVINNAGAMMVVPGHPHEHIVLCREHIGGDPPGPMWIDRPI